MEIGIVGLPNVGKSTLFNALTSGHAVSSNYPFTTIDPNVGITAVPDKRLLRLAEIFQSKKIVPAAIKFVDIAGLVKGASQGEGLGNQFLSHIREVDAIVHLVRLFDDANVSHSAGAINPERDIETIETELILADLESAEKQIQKLSGGARTGEKDSKKKIEILEKIKTVLNSGKLAGNSGFPSEVMKPFCLLTSKPTLFAGNITENSETKKSDLLSNFQSAVESRHCRWITLPARVESEIAELSSDEEKEKFRKELGFSGNNMENLIMESMQLLNLISFFTAGPKEVRAWNISKGSSAVDAAGKIHTDIAKGFIKAEVYSYEMIDRWDSEKILQEKGLIRFEGKEYNILEGDVCNFHFRN